MAGHLERDVLPPEWAAARALVLRFGWNPMAYQILNPGMRLWLDAAGDAVVGYARHGRTRVVAGAPVCEESRLEAVADAFERDAASCGERVLFFGAGARLERTLGARPGHRLARLGAQPVWDPAAWDAVVRGRASLRAQLHRARNKGVAVEEWDAARAAGDPALRAVLDEWLATRGLPPMHFLVEPDLLGRLADRRVFVARRGRDVVAYLVATPVPARDGWLVEQWPRTARAPNGTTQLLVDAAMRAFADAGARYATLGLAPLAARGPASAFDEPLWLRLVLGWVRAHGRRFYNFRGLEAFKAGLRPAAWEHVYAIAQARHFTPGLLRAVAGVFSGGAPEWFLARGAANALRAEVARLARGPR